MNLKTRFSRGPRYKQAYDCFIDLRRRSKANGLSCQFDSFEHFLKTMGLPKEKERLQRKDKRLGYSAENCFWMPKGTVKDHNKRSYAARAAKGLWLNRYQRIQAECLLKAKAYSTWVNLKRRVRKPTGRSACYATVTVCSEWLNSFDSFLKDMGKPSSLKLSIDRIDNKLGYSKSNCRWANAKIQGQNTRRTKCSMELAKKIRQLYATGNYTQTDLGEKFGLLQVTVSQVILNKIWRDD